MKKRAVVATGAAVILLCSAVAFAVGGTTGDPLISRAYLDGDYTAQLVASAEDRIASRHDTLYQNAEKSLEEKAALNSSQTAAGSYNASFSDIRVKEGDTVQVSAGSGFLLLAGSANISCTGNKTVDLSTGLEKASGAITAGCRYLTEENTVATVTVTSPTAVLSLEGYYALSKSGSTDYNALAGALKTMGLFRGTDTAYGSGYDLERAPTRVEGLVMFLRLLGEEPAAQGTSETCPFSDVPEWAQPYVAYAYGQGLTKGVDEQAMMFGTNNVMTASEYMTFLLRALGYQDNGEDPDFTWSNSLQRGLELGVLTAQEHKLLVEQPFLRAQVAYLSYYALDAAYKGQSKTLQERLVGDGILDASFVNMIRNGLDTERLD